MDIPEVWEKAVPDKAQGLMMVIGGPDTGKTTFAQYLEKRLLDSGRKVGFLDGDPGQSRLGPPTTMTCRYNSQTWRVFVGSTSPVKHMLQMLVGITRLLSKAHQNGAESVIYDTTGLIDRDQGGVDFKQAKIEITRPGIIFALQWNRELEPILSPFRKSNRIRIIDLKPSLAATSTSMYMRRRYRRLQFTKYFQGAKEVTLDWGKFGVFPRPFFTKYRLVALEDAEGLTIALGIAVDVKPQERKVTVKIPEISLEKVVALRVGNIGVDPISFEDQKIPP